MAVKCYWLLFTVTVTFCLFGSFVIFKLSNNNLSTSRLPFISLISPLKREVQTFKPFRDGPDNGSWWCLEMYKNLLDKMPDPYYKRAMVNPSTYEGFVRPDWPPERSLDFKDYIDMNRSIIMDFQDCIHQHPERREWKTKTTLMMMLHSNPAKGGEIVRNANRNTWMEDLKVGGGEYDLRIWRLLTFLLSSPRIIHISLLFMFLPRPMIPTSS